MQTLDPDLPEGPKAWRPFPGKAQETAYHSEADILFFGGSAGGGKSDLLIGLGLTEHYQSIIFRREYKQLRGIQDRIREVIGWDRYKEGKNIAYTVDGRTIELGAVQHEGDEQAFMGRPHDFIGFDEISHFMERQFRFLMGWLRTARVGARQRVVCTGNPPLTEEGEWVIDFWGPWLNPDHPKPAAPGELRWYAVIDNEDVAVESGDPIQAGDEVITPRSRTFIPAQVEDNPVYMRSGYKATLQNLPEPMRSKLLKGDFSALHEDDEWQLIPYHAILACVRKGEKPTGMRREWKKLPFTLSCDVARYGKDETVFALAKGNWVSSLESHSKQSTMKTVSQAMQIHDQLKEKGVRVRSFRVDDTGVGGGVTDRMLEEDYEVVPMNFGASPFDSERFYDLRSEMWWNVRELILAENCSLPNDKGLIRQLASPRYEVTSGRKIKLESKEHMMRRRIKSPDKGDAVVMVLYPEDWISRVGVF